MMAMENDKGVRAELEEKLGAEGLLARIAEKISEYHGLITKDAAEHLVALEVLGPRVRAATILQAKGTHSQCRLRVRVERIFLPKIFEGGGKSGMTQRFSASDHSGSATIVCYDDSCRMLNESVMSGDIVELEPVRHRGDEFHLSQGGKITPVQRGGRAKLAGSEGIGNFEGEVAEFFGDYPYRKGTGSAMMSSFSLRDGNGSVRVVLWDSPSLSGKLLPGTQVGIENGVRRGAEIHIGAAGRLLFALPKAEDDGAPKIEDIQIDEPTHEVRVMCGGKCLVALTFDEAAANFGIGQVPPGIEPATALSLKKNDWIGRHLPRKWMRGGKN